MSIKNVFKQYDVCLTNYPLVTKGITSGTISGIGDYIAQRIEHFRRDCKAKGKASLFSLDRTRSISMITWGGIIFAPIGHFWHNGLEKFVRTGGIGGIARKILLDQLVFTPPLIFAFFSVTKYMNGCMLMEAASQSIELVPSILKVNYIVWPVVHTITFGLIPLQYRLLFINFISLGWTTFLSLMSSGALID